MELFVNGTFATLASGIDAVTTTLPLTTGQGARFGTIPNGDKIRIAFLDASLNISEVAYMTAITADTATIVRGQDGTTAVIHLAGDRIEARVGKSTMDSLTQKATAGTDALAEMHAATSKATPVAADEIGIWDSVSGVLNKLTWANIVATLTAGFDLVYQGIGDYAALAGSATQVFSAGGATAVDHVVRADQIQTQSVTACTTTGTSTAYALGTLATAIGLTENERFRVKFHVTAGASPTLNRDSKGAKALMIYNSAGAKVPASSASIVAGMLADVEYDGTDYVVLDQLPPVISNINAYTTGASGWAVNTTYQNTYGRNLHISFRNANGPTGAVLGQISVDGVTWTTVTEAYTYNSGSWASFGHGAFIVPVNYYYRFSGVAIDRVFGQY